MDRRTTWNPQMEIFAHFPSFQAHLFLCFGSPLTWSWDHAEHLNLPGTWKWSPGFEFISCPVHFTKHKQSSPTSFYSFCPDLCATEWNSGCSGKAVVITRCWCQDDWTWCTGQFAPGSRALSLWKRHWWKHNTCRSLTYLACGWVAMFFTWQYVKKSFVFVFCYIMFTGWQISAHVVTSRWQKRERDSVWCVCVCVSKQSCPESAFYMLTECKNALSGQSMLMC